MQSILEPSNIYGLSRWPCQGNVFVLIFVLVEHVAPLCLQWQLAQLFPAAGAGGIMGQCSVYLSDVYDIDGQNFNKFPSNIFTAIINFVP
jgi:hypothetical protein